MLHLSQTHRAFSTQRPSSRHSKHTCAVRWVCHASTNPERPAMGDAALLRTAASTAAAAALALALSLGKYCAILHGNHLLTTPSMCIVLCQQAIALLSHSGLFPHLPLASNPTCNRGPEQCMTPQSLRGADAAVCTWCRHGSTCSSSGQQCGPQGPSAIQVPAGR